MDRGRRVDEKSAVVIEKGIFIGMGYFDLNYQITNIEVLKSLITPMAHNKDVQHIIQSYIRKNKALKIINYEH